MKYGFIFLVVLTSLFGGMCFGAIKSSQNYITSLSDSGNCIYQCHTDQATQ